MLRKFTITLPRFSRVLVSNLPQIQLEKHLHISPVTFAKRFQPFETEFVYNFVRKPELVKAETCENKFSLEQNYSEKTPEELVSIFESLTHYCNDTETCVSSEDFDELVSRVVQIIPNLADDQLIKVLTDLQRLPATPHAHTRNFQDLWSILDKTCCSRIKYWKYPELLKVANLWYQTSLSKVGNFTYDALIKISRRFHKLPAQQLVESMFYLNMCRKSIQMYDVESRFLKVFDDMNINQVGIMCLAFFKTETRMRTFQLIEKIYLKTIQEMDNNIPEITFVSILKTLRYSSEPLHAGLMEQLCEKMLPKIESYNLLTCLHVALLGTNLQYCHVELIDKIIRKFNDNIKEARLKDIERIAFALGLFNYKTSSGIEKDFLNKVMDELKVRVDEIMKYARCLPSTIHYLTISGIYDADVIKSVLNEEYINFAYGKNHFKIGREILCLDSFTRINLRDSYDGPRLSDKLRKNITKYQSHYVPERGQKWKMTHSDQLLLNVKEFMEEKYGKNMLTHILPHYQRPDVIYCFDDQGKSVTTEILDCFPPHYAGDILTKEYLLSQKEAFAGMMDKYKLVAVIVGGWNFFLRDTNLPTGGLRMKIEQLQMIGYKTILIHWSDWANMTSEQKHEYLNEEIEKVLQS